MDFLRSYPASLQRGTLLMVHTPQTHQRLARMQHTIHAESFSVVLIAGFVLVVGTIISERVALVIGSLLLSLAVISWMIRLSLLRWRMERTPGMIFISREGIEAILPDTGSVSLAWRGLQAMQITYVHRFGPNFSMLASALARRREVGLSLRSATGTMIYLADDLSGYDELLGILDELGIPTSTLSSRLLGIRGARSDWRHRLEARARQSRN